MEKTYPVMLGGQVVGEAKVHREGLYLVFSCACSFSGEMFYKLTVRDDNHSEELGIPVPERGRFRLYTKRPAKHFAGELSFFAQPKHSPLGGKFIPLSPEEPFAYMHRLMDAYLAVHAGQVGLVIPEEDV